MKRFASFSLLTLFLLTTIIALLFSHSRLRAKLREAEQLNHYFCELTGYIEIQDKRKLHLRRLKQTLPLIFSYQIFVPPGVTYAIHVGEGSLSANSAFPEKCLSGKVVGSDVQGALVISVRRIGKGWIMREMGQHAKMGGAYFGDAERFLWLERESESSERILDKLLFGPTTVHDPTETIVLFESENSRSHGLGDRPRKFVIWIEPISENAE
jgi:hypothetical protein